jgi:hypothetical protein
MVKKGILVVLVVILLSVVVSAISLPESPAIPGTEGSTATVETNTPEPITETDVILEPSVNRKVTGGIVKVFIENAESFILTEKLSSGMSASAISHDGVFNPTSREIKWVILEAPSSEISYVVTGAGEVQGQLTTVGNPPSIITIPSETIGTPVEPDQNDFSGFTDDLQDTSIPDAFPSIPTPTSVQQPVQSIPVVSQPAVQQPIPQPSSFGQATTVPLTQSDTAGLDSDIRDEFDTETLPSTISDEEKNVLFLKETQALANKTKKSHTGPIIFFMLLIALLAGGSSYYFIMEKVHGNIPHQHFHHEHRRNKEASAQPKNHNQMIYLLSYYISTNLKNGFAINQLYPMMRAQGYSEAVIKQAYQMAMKKWS